MHSFINVLSSCIKAPLWVVFGWQEKSPRVSVILSKFQRLRNPSIGIRRSFFPTVLFTLIPQASVCLPYILQLFLLPHLSFSPVYVVFFTWRMFIEFFGRPCSLDIIGIEFQSQGTSDLEPATLSLNICIFHTHPPHSLSPRWTWICQCQALTALPR